MSNIQYLSSYFSPLSGVRCCPQLFAPPHLIVFSTLLSLLSYSSNLLFSCPPHISWHSPPISTLASLVSSCPAHVTLPLSSVVCHPPSFLRVMPTVICSSPVSLTVKLLLTPPFSFWRSAGPPSPPQRLTTRSFRRYSSTYLSLSPSFRLHTSIILNKYPRHHLNTSEAAQCTFPFSLKTKWRLNHELSLTVSLATIKGTLAIPNGAVI